MKGTRRWPLLAISLPAFVAVWSGWVGLGQKTGFGLIHPLPGIADAVTINTAITLPFGGEAFASYALYLAVHPETPARARRFAWRASIAGLALGWFGQVAYHLMEAQGIASAPWWITVLVAGLPVGVVGASFYLYHLVHEAEARPGPLPGPIAVEAEIVPDEALPPPVVVEATRQEALPEAEARGTSILPGLEALEAAQAQAPEAEATPHEADQPARRASGPTLDDLVAAIEAGQITGPSRNAIKDHFGVGSGKADNLIRQYKAIKAEQEEIQNDEKEPAMSR